MLVKMLREHWAWIGGAAATLIAAAYVFWEPSKSKKRRGFPGLHNFGNSCFLNVILQSWAACPSILQWLGARYTEKHKASGSLTAAVFKVLKVLNNASEEPVPDVYSPANVLRAMERKGWVISPGQQDCHELMHALSETLDEEACPPPKVLSLFDVAALQDQRGSHQSSLVARTRITSHLPGLPRRQESPLHGLLASQISCLTCGHQCPVKYDVFDTITLTMPQYSFMEDLGLESLLASYVKPEVIENAYCPNCSKQRSTSKDAFRPAIKRTLTIGKLPQCLSIHIHRLQIAYDGTPIKRQEHVSFPEFVCMDSYAYNHAGSHILTKQGLCGGKQGLHTSHRATAAVNLLRALNYDATGACNGLFLRPPSPMLLPNAVADVNHNGPTSIPDITNNNIKKSLSNGHYTYCLTSVVSHLGDVESGHFVTYRRGPIRPKSEQEQGMAETWWLASDCTVEKVTLNRVLASQAYMLFYERV